MMNDNSIVNRYLVSGAGRREVRLETEVLDPASFAGHALVRNSMTLVYPGIDLGLVALSEAERTTLRLGRIAIGKVIAPAERGPRKDQWIYWNGPHADYGLLDPARDVWVPIEWPDPKLLPAGIGAEAQFGIHRACENNRPANAVVIGQGLLGHLAAQWLRYLGANVTVVENSPKRLEWSKYAGLRQKIDTHNLNWMQRLRKWNPAGAELLVDACGYSKPLLDVLPILREGGTVCLLGEYRQPFSDELNSAIAAKRASVVEPGPGFGGAPEHGPLAHEWMRLIAEGKIETERLLSNFPVATEAAMDVKRLAAGVKSILGVVIRWTED